MADSKTTVIHLCIKPTRREKLDKRKIKPLVEQLYTSNYQPTYSIFITPDQSFTDSSSANRNDHPPSHVLMK